jgi:hypothetical protein
MSATIAVMQRSGRYEDEIAAFQRRDGRHAGARAAVDPLAATIVASQVLLDVDSRSVGGVLQLVSLYQYRAMVMLARAPLTRQELAPRFHPDSRLESVLWALTDAGWAEARHDGTFALTPHGLQLVAHVESTRDLELSEILSILPRADRRAVADAFALFAAAAGTAPDHP